MDGASVTQKQVNFFDNLLNEKEFPAEAGTPEQLRAQFASLNKKSATEWIEKALALPDKGEVTESVVPAPFG